MTTWQAGTLDPIYLKVRDGQVANRPVYVAMGITLDSVRDVLGHADPAARSARGTCGWRDCTHRRAASV
jgi:transposase-like protein